MKRAKLKEESTRSERATVEEKPKVLERAIDSEKPAGWERANQSEKPISGERANDVEKPTIRERQKTQKEEPIVKGCPPICRDQACRYWQKMPPELEARYGNCVLRVAYEGPKTLEFIARILGITRERVRQIEAVALRKVARRIRKMGLAEVLEKPIKKERAKEKLRIYEQAIHVKKPISPERAVNREKPNMIERALDGEKPISFERAGSQEKPAPSKRTTNLEKFRNEERAEREEEPIDPKRAKNAEPPTGCERAISREKPQRSERYVGPVPYQFLEITEREIRLVRKP